MQGGILCFLQKASAAAVGDLFPLLHYIASMTRSCARVPTSWRMTLAREAAVDRNTMLDEKRIREIAQDVAIANSASTNVTSVSSSPTTDSEGHDALRITIVIKSGSEIEDWGRCGPYTLVGIQRRLRREGEERLAIVEYATKEELEAGGDS